MSHDMQSREWPVHNNTFYVVLKTWLIRRIQSSSIICAYSWHKAQEYVESGLVGRSMCFAARQMHHLMCLLANCAKFTSLLLTKAMQHNIGN